MNKIKLVDIESFRGISKLKLKDVGDINLIVGDNNVGKTSILEAIRFMLAPNDLMLIMSLLRDRIQFRYLVTGVNISEFQLFCDIFNLNKIENNVDIHFEDINFKTYNLSINGQVIRKLTKIEPKEYSFMNNKQEKNYYEDYLKHFVGYHTYIECQKGEITYNYQKDIDISENYRTYEFLYTRRFNIRYVSPVDHFIVNNVSSVIAKGKKKELIDLLRLIDGTIEDYNIIKDENGNPREVITTSFCDKTIPLYLFGDGLKKVLMLAAEVINAQDGILLLDEIETSMHKSLFDEVFSWLIKACKKYNVQVFATTHNFETVSTFAKYGVEYDSDLVCYKIKKCNNKFYTTRYGEEELNEIVNGFGGDVR